MKDFSYESLISTMGSDGKDLIQKMNVKSQAILINQQDKFFHKEYKVNQCLVKELGFNEKGVGLSRNNALMRSAADICLMADDDMVYVDDYLTKIEQAYKKYPDADMILFNVRIHNQDGVSVKTAKEGRLHYLNSLKYGTVTFTFKREKILKHNISFSLLFGGGAKFSNGEDSLFLWDCLNAGLKIYSCTDVIADVYNYESSWFSGYNEKFFTDRGALFEALSSRFSLLLIYQFAIRKQNVFKHDYSLKETISMMKRGRSLFRSL